MNFITWAPNPWGQEVPIHIAWFLLWVSLFAGLAFLVVHAVWVRFRPKAGTVADDIPPEIASRIPEKVPRHSLAARLFHWIMAAAMLTLLFSAFLPKAGLRFPWVEIHWTAGVVLVLAILFHLVHGLLFMDFRAIWPDIADVRAPSAKPGKYPLGNKLYHLAIMAAGLAMAVTGVLMMSRVRTPFFTRNPYLFDDMTWGVVYLLHGFAGVCLIALAIIHIYFALRPEKRPITLAMLSGTMSRDYYLEHHDPRRWVCEKQASQ